MGLAGRAQTTSTTPGASAAQQTPTNSSASTPSQQNVPPLQFHNLPPAPHTPTPAEAAQERQQRILMQVARLANMQAQWGPQESTPGMSIELKEVGRTKAPDGTTQIAWQITGKGFPADQNVVLMRWPLDASPQTVMSGLQVDSQGMAVCTAPVLPATGAASGSSQQPTAAAASGQSGAAPAAPAPSKDVPPLPPSCAASTKPGQPVEVRAAVAPGEAVRVALVGESEKDGKPVRIGAATSLVPFPMENTDQGCTLQVIRGMKNAAMVLVEGSGFPAKTTMKVDSVTGSETRTLTVRTNEKGHFIMATLPALEGHDEGDTTIRMGGIIQPPSLETPKTPAAPPSNCNPSVTFHWGKDSYKPQ
ncbi:MAG: hypothetical protein WBW84_15470 [Acidobacteriaceae bacterium]